MNKERRKAIEEIIDQLGTLKEELEFISEEEQEAYNNLPESIQYSERGESMSEAVSDMEQAYGDIESVIDMLQEIIDR